MRLQQLRRTPDYNDGTLPLLQTHYGDDNNLTLGYHPTFEIESETSAVNPTILVKN